MELLIDEKFFEARVPLFKLCRGSWKIKKEYFASHSSFLLLFVNSSQT